MIRKLKDIPAEEKMKTNFPVRLPKLVHAKYKAQCAIEGVSMSDKIIELIEQYLKKVNA